LDLGGIGRCSGASQTSYDAGFLELEDEAGFILGKRGGLISDGGVKAGIGDDLLSVYVLGKRGGLISDGGVKAGIGDDDILLSV